MNEIVKWAFAQKVGTGEKLALVYLASRASAVGVGNYSRADLEEAVDYETRSVQRLLKNLRDAGLFIDLEGGWYSVGPQGVHVQPPDDRVIAAMAPHLMQPFPTYMEARISERDQEAAGERIAQAIAEQADAFIARMNDVNLRLLQGLERIAQEAAWTAPPGETLNLAPPAPPPDPVRESVHFKAFMQGGMLSEDEAYELAAKRLVAEGIQTEKAAAGDGYGARGLEPPSTRLYHYEMGGFSKATDLERPAVVQYADSPRGRFHRVFNILFPPGSASPPSDDYLPAWQRLEEEENKHSVGGETPAFELLYPAIVQSARRVAGTMGLDVFLDPRAIREGRAPWDVSTAVVPSDAELNASLAIMLNDIERASHPMAQVGPRTTEKGEDSIVRTESLAAYHARVKRVHEQLKKLQQMGV